MFVMQLTLDERQALMSLLVSIAKADGKLNEMEKEFLKYYAKANSINLNLDEEISIDDACKLIKTQKGKIIALQEIIKIAFADGQYDENEKKGVRIIAQNFGVSESKLQEIEEWVQDGEEWANRGLELIKEN
jgi:uncharacterized tellurite resistance protein B-like protein